MSTACVETGSVRLTAPKLGPLWRRREFDALGATLCAVETRTKTDEIEVAATQEEERRVEIRIRAAPIAVRKHSFRLAQQFDKSHRYSILITAEAYASEAVLANDCEQIDSD